MTASRIVIDSHTRNQVALVDQAIRSQGELALIFYPLHSTENLYGERTVEDYVSLETALIFNWDEYRTALKFSDVFTESQIPLTARAAIEDHIPVDSIIKVNLENPNDDSNEPPSLETGNTQAVCPIMLESDSVIIQGDNVDIELTIAEEIEGIDSRGVKGNEWSVVIDFAPIPSDEFSFTDFIVIDSRNKRFNVRLDGHITEDITISWNSQSLGTSILNEGLDTALNADDEEIPLIFPFEGGKGAGINFPEYRKVSYVGQSTDFKVVKNELQHEHFAYQRRLTMVPTRTNESIEVATTSNVFGRD